MTTTATASVLTPVAHAPSLGEAALDCARRGWAVFPVFGLRAPGRCECPILACRNVAKHPMTRHGLRDATKDEAVIRAHWRAAPKANIGLATGAVRSSWSARYVVSNSTWGIARTDVLVGLWVRWSWWWASGPGGPVPCRSRCSGHLPSAKHGL